MNVKNLSSGLKTWIWGGIFVSFFACLALAAMVGACQVGMSLALGRPATTKELFSLFGGILFVAGFIPYISYIWKTRHLKPGTPGKAEPQKSSWILWWSLDTILFVGMAIKHQFNGQLTVAVVGALAVLVLALKYGKSGFSRLEKICMVIAVLAVVMGYVLNDARISIVLGIVALFMASIPTFVSVWEDPRRESKSGWLFIWGSCLFTVASVSNWSIEEAAQPLAFLLIDSIAVAIIVFRKVPEDRMLQAA